MDKTVKEILKICDEFLQVPSVVGHEQPFLNFLEKKFSKLGYDIVKGERYLVIKGKNPKYLISVHVDRHGLIRNDLGDLEYGAFLLKKKYRLNFKRDDFDFYQGCGLRHSREKVKSYSGKKSEIIRFNLNHKEKFVSFDFDKGLESENVFMFDSKVKVHRNLFSAQIDNVISAAVLYYILKEKDFNHDIIFTTEEEIGRSYNCILDYNSSLPLIVLDTSPYENFNGKDEGFLVLREGDENGKFDLDVVKHLKLLLGENNVSVNFKPSEIGMTELGRVSSESKGKINGGTLQLPTMNYHTSYETSTLESLDNYYKIIKKL